MMMRYIETFYLKMGKSEFFFICLHHDLLYIFTTIINNFSIREFEFFQIPLSEEDEEDPEFRYLSSDCGIQPNKRNNYGIPKDVIDMFRASSSSSNGSSASEHPNTLDDVINNRLGDVRNYFSF